MFRFIKSIFKSIGKGINNDPEVQKIKNRYPRFFHFLKKRLTPNEKFGLDLTIGTIITLFFIYIFFGILQDYIGQEPLIQSDLRIINLAQMFRTPVSNQVMLFITYLGSWQIVFLGAFFICLILFLRKRWYHLWTFIISVGGGEILVWIIKNLVERPRPPLINALAPETSFSFPSGHSFVALSFYGLLFYYLFRIFKSKILKFISVFFGATLILSIGISRIYLGVHWPSDVLASFAVGSAWLTTLITIIEIKKKYNPHKFKTPFLKKKYILSLSIFLSILWFTFIGFYFHTHPLKPQPTISNKKIIINENSIIQTIFNKLPRFSETTTGSPMEPINVIIIGSENNLNNAFKTSGWFRADQISIKSFLKLVSAVLFKQYYPQSPGTPSFWNKIPNEISFEKPAGISSVTFKNHLHIWHTPFVTEKNVPVWLGTVHFDKELKKSQFLIPVHTIDPAVDKEREIIKNDLQKNGQIDHFYEIKLVEPTLGKNLVDPFFTDGKALIIFLKNN
jgi:membrane-associated phospholipid phosphatase